MPDHPTKQNAAHPDRGRAAEGKGLAEFWDAPMLPKFKTKIKTGACSGLLCIGKFNSDVDAFPNGSTVLHLKDGVVEGVCI